MRKPRTCCTASCHAFVWQACVTCGLIVPYQSGSRPNHYGYDPCCSKGKGNDKFRMQVPYNACTFTTRQASVIRTPCVHNQRQWHPHGPHGLGTFCVWLLNMITAGAFALNPDGTARDPLAFQKALQHDQAKLQALQPEPQVRDVILGENIPAMQSMLRLHTRYEDWVATVPQNLTLTTCHYAG